MTVKVAINGFGRIGRNVLRAIIESGRTDIEVVAINDLGPVETNAHLLRFDSVHGRFPGTVTTTATTIDAGRGPMEVTAIKNPADLPWAHVDIVMECTGIFTDKDKAVLSVDSGWDDKDELEDDTKDANGKRKRGPKTTIKPPQLEILKTCFDQNPKPSPKIFGELAQDTGLTKRVIQVILREI